MAGILNPESGFAWTPRRFSLALTRLWPGLGLCIAVTIVAYGAQAVEARYLGRAWLEALVLAILLGTAVRTVCKPEERWFPGIGFSAKFLLEVAVVLLGASVSAQTLSAAGLGLPLGIVAVVTIAISASYVIGRILGLSQRLAILVACGNSICGNSAIAAVAPVIGADGEDVAASIAFTAVLGVIVVLVLPLVGLAAGFGVLAYGAFAGLTVYAVPQVLAAAAPFGAQAVQMGTLVKLVRVLMLGPVCVGLALLLPGLRDEARPAGTHVVAGDRPRQVRPPIHHVVPWFIAGFLILATARSFGAIPADVLAPMAHVSGVLTVLSMAALGLGVDLRSLARAGGRVTLAVLLSLLVLGGIAAVLLRLLGL